MTVRRWKGGGMIKIMGGGSGDEPKRMPFVLQFGILVITLLLFAVIAVTGYMAFTRPDIDDRGAGLICAWGLMWVLCDIRRRWSR